MFSVALLGGNAPERGTYEYYEWLSPKAVRATQRTNVHHLDESLESERLESWLKRVLPRESKVEWESNDCGEQSGSPDPDPDFPICGQATVELPQDRELILMVMVGTYQDGIKGKPAVWGIYIVSSPDTYTEIKKLSELPAALRAVARLRS